MQKRMTVRPVPQISVMDKRFKPVSKAVKRIDVHRTGPHQRAVVMDLKKGVTTSLVRYIIRKRKIDDLEILLCLIYLLAGPSEKTKYRLLPILHPDLAAKRGRKRNPKPALTVRETRYTEDYDAEYVVSQKHTASIARAAELNDVSWWTIEQAVRKRRKILESEHLPEKEAEIDEGISKFFVNLTKGKKLNW